MGAEFGVLCKNNKSTLPLNLVSRPFCHILNTLSDVKMTLDKKMEEPRDFAPAEAGVLSSINKPYLECEIIIKQFYVCFFL